MKIVKLILIIIFFGALVYIFYPKSAHSILNVLKSKPVYVTLLPKVEVFINNEEFSMEVAQSDAEKELGLGYRDGLNPNSGMLFVFKSPAVQNFWMKDMNFPIDIVWVDKNKKILGIKESAKPEDYPEVYKSPSAVAYVLEIEAGIAKKHQIKIGDSVIFDLSSLQKTTN